MRKILLSLCLLVATMLVAQTPKPFVIPELKTWESHNGTFTLSSATAVSSDAALNDVAKRFVTDYKKLIGDELNLKSASSQAIYFTLNKSVLADKGVEAYQIDITPEKITVKANDAKGAFWATRTLLQLAEQNRQLPAGTITDYPDYAVRAFMLDVGRKFFSMDYLRKTVEMMSYYKMNTFHVHLNDNGFVQFYGGDWSKTQAAFRLESETYPGLTAKDGSYTKDEFRQFQKDALHYGVTIIPEIDVPAHSLAFVHFMPELSSKIYGEDHLDLFNPKTYEVLDNLFDEYLRGDDPVFVNELVHIGTDEYSNKKKEVVEKFRHFTDYYIRKVESYGKRAMVWGSLTHAKGDTPVKVDNVLMHAWSTGYANPQEMMDLGYDLVSIPDGWVYIVPAAGYYYDYLNIENLYNKWTPAQIGNFKFEEKHPQIKGGSFAVWNDHPGNGISFQDVHHRTYPAMQTIATKVWNTTPTTSFADFNAKRIFLSEAPGLNMLGRPAGLKKGVQFEVKRPKQGAPLGEALNDIGFNYRVSFDIMPLYNKKGTALFSSDYSVFYVADPENGNVGFSRDGYTFSFNYALPMAKKSTVTIEGTNNATTLYVNGEKIQTLDRIMHPDDKEVKGYKRSKVRTLVFPLKNVHEFNGTLRNLKVEYLGE